MAERLNVNPTRMELLSLKKRLEIAVRGHKLLKDKRDELMREFLSLVEKNRLLRRNVEERLSKAFSSFLMAKAVMSQDLLESSILFNKTDLKIESRESQLMGVSVPHFQWNHEENGQAYPYGFADTSGDLDSFMGIITETLPQLLELSEVEKTVILLAEEIEKTRRRVNALEHVLIPRLKETIRYISMKLEERERSNLTRLMKIKDIIRS